jgi:hypothetical protein
MTKPEQLALTAVEQLADEQGYVDLRQHTLHPNTIDELRKIECRDRDIVWFPSNHRAQFGEKGRQLAREIRRRWHVVGLAQQYNFSDCERGILIALHKKPFAPGMLNRCREMNNRSSATRLLTCRWERLPSTGRD